MGKWVCGVKMPFPTRGVGRGMSQTSENVSKHHTQVVRNTTVLSINLYKHELERLLARHSS